MNKNQTKITYNYNKMDPKVEAITNIKIQFQELNTDFKLHQLKEAQDLKLMKESKRILREMINTENRKLKNGREIY